MVNQTSQTQHSLTTVFQHLPFAARATALIFRNIGDYFVSELNRTVGAAWRKIRFWYYGRWPHQRKNDLRLIPADLGRGPQPTNPPGRIRQSGRRAGTKPPITRAGVISWVPWVQCRSYAAAPKSSNGAKVRLAWSAL